VALEIASFDLHGAVDSICNPRPIILGQIPAGDALLQLLEDHPKKRDHKEFPPLSKPFHLGPPGGHECGEAYNVFFRTGGRFFQLRIWTKRIQQAPFLAVPGRAVRSQIEAMMNSLRIVSSAESPRGGTGGGSSAAAAPRDHKPVAVRWTRCPPSHGDPPGASNWAGSVAGISCHALGKLIVRHFLRYPTNAPSGSDAIRVSDPSTFHSAGFHCTAFPLEDGGGWHNVCDQGDRHISFFFTP
jgi:hypothetical protein